MDSFVRKQVGRLKPEEPLKQLEKINASLKQLGCSFKPDDSATVYRKIVGRKKNVV